MSGVLDYYKGVGYTIYEESEVAKWGEEWRIAELGAGGCNCGMEGELG